jgi:polar amino acid transport system permease protein
LNWLIVFAVDLFRALPPLVVIALLYFGLPAAGLSLSGFAAAWLALSLVLMAFSERSSGPASPPCRKGSGSGALHRPRLLPTLRLVVLPQALRITVPPLTNRTIAITKNTALASVVAVPEYSGAAQAGVSFGFNPTPLTLGAAAYLVLFLPVVVLGRWVETRFAWKR